MSWLPGEPDFALWSCTCCCEDCLDELHEPQIRSYGLYCTHVEGHMLYVSRQDRYREDKRLD